MPAERPRGSLQAARFLGFDVSLSAAPKLRGIGHDLVSVRSPAIHLAAFLLAATAVLGARGEGRGAEVGQGPSAPRDSAQIFLRGLARSECDIRREAVFEVLRTPAGKVAAVIAEIKAEIPSRSSAVVRKARVVLEALEQGEAGRSLRPSGEAVSVEIERIVKAPPGERDRESQAAKDRLIRLVRDRGRPLHERIEAISVIGYVVSHYFGAEKDVGNLGLQVSDWRQALVELLVDRDSEVAVMTAVEIGERSQKVFRDIPTSRLIPRLIWGLRHKSFHFRLVSQRVLENLMGGTFCIDPSESAPERERTIRTIEEWWRANQPTRD